MFRAALEAAVPRADRSKGGRRPFDHVFMFKVLILQAMHSLSDERCEYLIKDRLSFMRFLGLGLADAVPDANTIWTFREALKKAHAADVLFEQFDAALRRAGFLAMSDQIVDATIVAAPKQRNANGEKQAIKDGRIPEGWKDKPAKLAQKGWTVKYTKAKVREDGSVPLVDLAIPAFGYKNHVSIDRAPPCCMELLQGVDWQFNPGLGTKGPICGSSCETILHWVSLEMPSLAWASREHGFLLKGGFP